MNRRQFVSSLIAASGGVALAFIDSVPEPDPAVKRVLVMFKCHFDAGFINTQAEVVKKYFEQYFPEAIELAGKLRDTGDERYVWTTGSWLIYQYLEKANVANRKRMEKALVRGDIAWHALPFSWQTELLDRSAIAGLIGLSKSLDKRFGRKTTGSKMTDVPGHSRGLIGPLAENGVKLLDIGVNSASTPPDVPEAFLWKNHSGSSLVMIYHRRGYGGVVRIPSSDLAVAVEMRDDNSGPHTEQEVHQIYASLKQQFPNASVRASNLTDIAEAVDQYRASLPVVTQEIGDTWIYGVASDPVKVAHYRELLRLRRSWIALGKFRTGDSTDRAFLSHFGLAAEHTWGTDTKTWLDFDHYSPTALAQVLDEPNYKTVTASWVEKRNDIAEGTATLPAALQNEAHRHLAGLKPVRPDMSHLQAHDSTSTIETTHFKFALDRETGAIVQLQNKSTGREWSSPSHPLMLFSYQTLSKADYDQFLASYITVQTDWAPKDFGKPNIEKFGARSYTWTTKMTGCLVAEEEQGHRIVAKLEIDEGGQPASGITAWPGEIYIEFILAKSEPTIHCTISWFGKRANRLPEAIWLSFNPLAPQAGNWLLSKVEQPVSPNDVVPGGNRHMHAISDEVAYSDEHGRFSIETLDAPLLSLGERTPIYFSRSQPDLAQGLHFCLFNNGWGTNYIQWFAEDMQFRFTVRA
jgi:hypothetical protein